MPPRDHPSKPRPQDAYPVGTTVIGETTIVRTTTFFRRTSSSTKNPNPPRPTQIDYQRPDQHFDCLYAVITQMVAECGACCRADLALIPALSRYTLYQIERALLTAENYGLLKRIGSIKWPHPDAPEPDDIETPPPGIYEIDPNGCYDPTDPDATVRRALNSRTALESTWLGAKSCTQG